jgi:5-methylcytosine-specific restriction endonuclease McrA
MAEHGTRTMYVHYGCRCEDCCRAEHKQYLKRETSKKRKRTSSKWGENRPHIQSSNRIETQKRYNAERYRMFKERTSTHTRPIVWQEIADKYGMKCAICGCTADPNDTWERNGRLCYGRKYPTVDHIIALKNGGTDTIENVQLACKRCNSKKGAKENELIS